MLTTTADTIHSVAPQELSVPQNQVLVDRLAGLSQHLEQEIYGEAILLGMFAIAELHGPETVLSGLQTFPVNIKQGFATISKDLAGDSYEETVDLPFIAAWFSALEDPLLLSQIETSLNTKIYPEELAYPFLWTIAEVGDDDRPEYVHRMTVEFAQIVYLADTGRQLEATKRYDLLAKDPVLYKPDQGWVEFFHSGNSGLVASTSVQIYTNLWSLLALISMGRSDIAREKLISLQQNPAYDVSKGYWHVSNAAVSSIDLTETILQIIVESRLAKLEAQEFQSELTLPQTLNY